jgi:UTP:GlnB (protein PII) uridylyltransferase
VSRITQSREVDHARMRLAEHLKTGCSREQQLRSWSRIADGAVIGLSHLARLCVGAPTRSAIAPFALVAVGKYGARCCDLDVSLELQCLVPEDEESEVRSGRILAFVQAGLTELGLQHSQGAQATAHECARAVQSDPMVAARFATTRFLSGQYGLYLGFAGILAGPDLPRVFDANAFPLAAGHTSTGTCAAPPWSAFEDRAYVGCDKIR